MQPYHVFVFPLLLMISANYLDEILGCDLQRIMTQYVFVRHVCAFLTLLFFLVIVDNSSDLSRDTFMQKFGVALSAYVFFILFCKTEGHVAVVLLCVIATEYFLSVYRKSLEEPPLESKTKQVHAAEIAANQPTIRTISRIENAMFVIILVLLVVGVIAYIGKQSYKREQWVWTNFFFGCGKGCNLQRKFTFGDLTAKELWSEFRRGCAKITRG